MHFILILCVTCLVNKTLQKTLKQIDFIQRESYLGHKIIIFNWKQDKERILKFAFEISSLLESRIPKKISSKTKPNFISKIEPDVKPNFKRKHWTWCESNIEPDVKETSNLIESPVAEHFEERVMGTVATHALQVVVLAAHTNTLENLKYIKLDWTKFLFGNQV